MELLKRCTECKSDQLDWQSSTLQVRTEDPGYQTNKLTVADNREWTCRDCGATGSQVSVHPPQ